MDVHTHLDAAVCWDPYLAPAPHNGTTTVVFGNCGVGFAPMRRTPQAVEYICALMEGVEEIPASDLVAGVPFLWESFSDFLNHIEALPHAIDFGANLAFSCVRAFVMGIENAGGVPTADEMREMKALVEEAMRDGAMGICASRSANHRAASDSGPGSKCRPLFRAFFLKSL